MKSATLLSFLWREGMANIFFADGSLFMGDYLSNVLPKAVEWSRS